MFYYKSLTNNYITKSEEESIVGMIQITENEYNQLKLANKQRIAKKVRINELKKLLSQSDYKAIKYAEGLISAQDYEPIKQLRQSYRDEINQLESEV